MAVEVVRRDVDLVGVGQRRDLQRLRDAVPGRVHDGHVHRLPLEELAVAAPRVLALERGQRDVDARADVVQRGRVEGVDLHPEEVERRHGARDLHEALRAEVEVEVHQDVHVAAGALAERRQLVAQRADDPALGVEPGHLGVGAREAGHVRVRGARVEQEDVGLERREPPGHDFLALGDDVVQPAQRRDLHLLRGEQAEVAAVRPVEPQPLALGPPEQLVHGNAERPRLRVEQRVLDGGDGLLDHAARRLPAHGVERGDDGLAGARILADHQRRQAVDGRADADAAEGLVVLAPADDAVIGGELEEVERALAGVGVQVLEARDLHAALPRRPRIQA